MEILQTLGINWQLLLAQILNFGIIATVLAVLVYKPVLKLVDERRAKIEKAMKDAESIAKSKQEMDDVRVKHLRKVDDESKVMLDEAKKHADAVKTELLTKAQKEADALLQKGHQQLENERREALESLQGTVTKVIVSMTEKILSREFNAEDQKRIMANLEKELPSLLK